MERKVGRILLRAARLCTYSRLSASHPTKNAVAPLLRTTHNTITDTGAYLPGCHQRRSALDLLKAPPDDGLEEEQLEYSSNVTWGEGRFIRPKDNADVTDIPAGRYQVLVQDLDYGWPLDRRGTITIGNEQTVVHVKRSFQTHRLQSSGAYRFPMSFRWAGKSYQIDTPDDVQIVNGLLAATAEKQNYVTPESFRTHPLFVDAVNIDTQGGGHSLRHHRTLAQIDVQSSDMLAGFRSPLGVLARNQKCVSPRGVFVPTQGLEMFVTDRLFGWGINGWIDHRTLAMDNSLAMPLV